MIRLKPRQAIIDTHKPKDATELAWRPGNGGVVPPIEHRFKPGKDWTGNAGGRPRKIRQAYERRLTKEVEVTDVVEEGGKLVEKAVKMTVADAIAKNVCDIAMTSQRSAVGAAQEIRNITEPTEEEQKGSSDREFTRLIVQLLMERKVNARET